MDGLNGALPQPPDSMIEEAAAKTFNALERVAESVERSKRSAYFSGPHGAVRVKVGHVLAIESTRGDTVTLHLAGGTAINVDGDLESVSRQLGWEE
ncbi:MAG: hypothetical protein DYG93_11205 [Leptolyngbya sp. PLA2]|nr:hypothetical protein [Leptolyngbya sp. PL-A2]MCQ3941211.1 hypothetical protein [cyanobacterium CYA1]